MVSGRLCLLMSLKSVWAQENEKRIGARWCWRKLPWKSVAWWGLLRSVLLCYCDWFSYQKSIVDGTRLLVYTERTHSSSSLLKVTTTLPPMVRCDNIKVPPPLPQPRIHPQILAENWSRARVEKNEAKKTQKPRRTVLSRTFFFVQVKLIARNVVNKQVMRVRHPPSPTILQDKQNPKTSARPFGIWRELDPYWHMHSQNGQWAVWHTQIDTHDDKQQQQQ